MTLFQCADAFLCDVFRLLGRHRTKVILTLMQLYIRMTEWGGGAEILNLFF